MKAQFQGDLGGWQLTFNNSSPGQTCLPAQPKANPPSFSFPNMGPNNSVGLSAHPGQYWIAPAPGMHPNFKGTNTPNTYLLEKTLPATNKGGVATLKARCLALSNQFLAVHISTDFQGVGACVAKLWNAPFPGKPAEPFTNFKDLSFTIPAGACSITLWLSPDVKGTGATTDIVDFLMPE